MHLGLVSPAAGRSRRLVKVTGLLSLFVAGTVVGASLTSGSARASSTSATTAPTSSYTGGLPAAGGGSTLPPTGEPYAVPEPAGAQDTGVNPAYFEPGTPQYEQGVMGASSSKT